MVTQSLDRRTIHDQNPALPRGYACLRGPRTMSTGAGLRVRHTYSGWAIARVALMLTLAAMPILAISAHVFGLASEQALAIYVVVPVAALVATVLAVAPHRVDAIFARGLMAGMVACAVYDGFRLFAVHRLGWMGDFIPVMGTWITGDPESAGSAVVGYLWRYIGDGGGLGIAFFVVASAIGLDRRTHRPARVVLAAVGFAVFPVWAGLIGTVALAPRGQQLMFELTVKTIATTLIGHLIFGLILGLLFVRTRGSWQSGQWPWSSTLMRWLP